jgi:integrase
MNSIIISTPQDNALSTDALDLFAEVVGRAVSRLKSTRSRRVYLDTYDRWQTFCDENGLSPWHYTPDNVEAFIHGIAGAQSTGNRMLSSMRKLALTAATSYPANDDLDRLERMLKKFKGLTIDRTAPEHKKRALVSDDVFAAVNVWTGNGNKAQRNRALMRVLFHCGLRRFEAAALQWSDIDLERGTLTVRAGKGGKERTVPIIGDSAVNDIQRWRDTMTSTAPDNPYVFPALLKGGKFATGDKMRPIKGDAVWRVVRETSKKCGVEFKPHDARRTLITGILDAGGAVHDAQAVAGHADGSTTLLYAQSRNAADLRDKLKLAYA